MSARLDADGANRSVAGADIGVVGVVDEIDPTMTVAREEGDEAEQIRATRVHARLVNKGVEPNRRP